MAISKTYRKLAILPYLVGGGVIIYFLFKFLKRNGQTALNVKNISVKKSDLSKSLTALKIIADNQFIQLNGYGTSYSDLIEDIEGLNNEDLKQVFKFFGLRCSTISLFPGTSQCVSPKLNLFQWYKTDLTESNYNLMMEKWQNTGLI